jgi:hypothetical protein
MPIPLPTTVCTWWFEFRFFWVCCCCPLSPWGGARRNKERNAQGTGRTGRDGMPRPFLTRKGLGLEGGPKPSGERVVKRKKRNGKKCRVPVPAMRAGAGRSNSNKLCYSYYGGLLEFL